mmetsp:Transcript_7549/g.10891  ORF Transcript_7549/g.10891 Transcript_7549/m.10891 type:complete len:133 (-) Transcript_7549:190-588(-)
MWSFPEEDKSLLGYNMVKMGYPNWKGSFLRPLAAKARKSKDKKLKKKDFAQYVKTLASREGLKGMKARIEKAWAEMDQDGDGLVEPWRLFRCRELRFILKDVSVGMEGGRPPQEEESEDAVCDGDGECPAIS